MFPVGNDNTVVVEQPFGKTFGERTFDSLPGGRTARAAPQPGRPTGTDRSEGGVALAGELGGCRATHPEIDRLPERERHRIEDGGPNKPTAPAASITPSTGTSGA